jgi:cytochrome c-type biogenesis protein CcmE
MKKYTYLFFIVPVMFTLALSACSREKSYETKEGKVTVKEDGKKVQFKGKDEDITVSGDENQGQVKIKTKDGESTISYNKDKLPDNFPKDIPIYSPASVQMSQIMDNGKTVMASLNTTDDMAKVAAFYKKALTQAGWEIKADMNMGNTFLVQGEKGEQSLNVSATKEQDKTVITLALGEK